VIHGTNKWLIRQIYRHGHRHGHLTVIATAIKLAAIAS
jgi:hypothetical protein